MDERVTPQTLRARKQSGEPIAGLTAYDYPTAVLVDRAGLDLVLVGDSLGQLILGKARIEDTTMEDMIHHCAAVSRGVARAMVIGDMPFGSYETDPAVAVENALRLVKDGGVAAVKVEGGAEVVPAVRAISAADVTVIGHLTPAHVADEPTEPDQATALVDAARALEDAGAAAIVLVGIPEETARAVTASLQTIPSIGYQSGPHCDGQLLVTPYMLGLIPPQNPVPGPYGAFGKQFLETFTRFRADVYRQPAGESEMYHPVVEEIRGLLEKEQSWYETFEHGPVRTSEEAAATRPGYTLHQGAKAIIVQSKDARGERSFVMLVFPADRKLDSKRAKLVLGAKSIRFASEDEVAEVARGVEVGAIPPFGNLFGLDVVADRGLFEQERIVFNAGDRRFSVAMTSADYRRLVRPIEADIVRLDE